MSIEHLAANLRLLCSYGRSTSDVCRRAGINRHQFNRYLTGQSRPSLSTLRRICDFFGVDDHEILFDQDDFQQLVRLRPPRLGAHYNEFERAVEHLVQPSEVNQGLLNQHEGYYFTYVSIDPARGSVLRSLSRIHRQGDTWLSKTIERQLPGDFMVPSRLKYAGIVMEGLDRIVINQREQGGGRSLWSTMLYTGPHGEPSFLSGLTLGMWPEGSHDINCVRTVWQYLGKSPDLRMALRQCGAIDLAADDLPEFVRQCTDNTRTEGEFVFFAKF